ncbi:ISL3 family transposase [soil metagenome]
MQFDERLFLGKESLQLQRLEVEGDHVSLFASTTTKAATCPLCGGASDRVHSRYSRTISDLPWHGMPVTLYLRIQRFFCEHYACRRVIFAERVSELAGDYARKTARLESALSAVGFALGGEAGSRLAEELGLLSSPDTLLRRVRSTPLPDTDGVRVLGVDDWAFRRGNSSGTILVDLERRRPIDLLEGSQASTFAEWLRSHPEVEFISRDRGGAYAEAAREAAPEAVQVLDRWHLLKNLSEHLESFVNSHRSLVEQAAAEVRSKQTIDASLAASAETMLSSKTDTEKQANRQKRYERYLKVIELHEQGLSERAITRTLCINRGTVRKFLHSDGFPERGAKKRTGSILDPYIPYIHQRWAEGCDNSHQLWREIRERGYEGEIAMVRRYTKRLRRQLTEIAPQQRTKFLATKEAFKAPTSRRVGRWLEAQWEDLTEAQRAFVARLGELCPAADKVGELARWFREMVKERTPAQLDDWLEAAEQSPVVGLLNFAQSLRKDYEAVRAGLSYEWSQGQVEGQITRLKLVKRQMYGRANFDLLKQRTLAAA